MTRAEMAGVLAAALAVLVLTALLVGCATARPSPASLTEILTSLRCQHAALNAWDAAELARVAETCGPTVADCGAALGDHEARLLAARVALALGYRAVQLAATDGAAAHAAARVAASKVGLGHLGVPLAACP